MYSNRLFPAIVRIRRKGKADYSWNHAFKLLHK